MSSGSVPLLLSPLHLHFSTLWSSGATEPLLHRRSGDSVTQRISPLKPYHEVFWKLTVDGSSPLLVSVYQKCDTTRLPNGRGPIEIPLCGHGWPVWRTCRGTSHRLWMSSSETSYQGLMTEWLKSQKEEEESKHTVGLCMFPPPLHLPLVYSLFQFLKVDLLMLNFVTMVAFSGSDWPVVQ